MNDNKDIVLTTINDTKEEIKSFKRKLTDKGKQLPDVKSIANSLKDIDKVVNSIKKLCTDETKVLESLIENLSYAQIKELLNKTDIMFDVINDNLPNGMELRTVEKYDNDEFEKTKEIWFDGNIVGRVQILDETKETLYIKVTINDCIDTFEVVMPNRMYHIISFINTKFNYE